MSIQTEIDRISGNVSDALLAISAKGVNVPSGSNSDSLAELIGSIQSAGELESKLFVASGSTITYESNTIVYGFVSGGRSSIFLAVPVAKLLTNVTGVRVTAISGHMRNDGGYGLTSAAANSNYLNYVTDAVIERGTNSVRISIRKNSGEFYLTNNQPVTFVPSELSLKFT